jgi:hypothetical protein
LRGYAAGNALIRDGQESLKPMGIETIVIVVVIVLVVLFILGRGRLRG